MYNLGSDCSNTRVSLNFMINFIFYLLYNNVAPSCEKANALQYITFILGKLEKPLYHMKEQVGSPKKT